MYDMTPVQLIAISILPLLFAITLHEVAHGYVASLFGDQTAKLSGRLTLNPIKHIDLIGTIIVPILLWLTTSFIFGWAKPVPVDARNLRNPRRDMAIVALAGPAANLIMAIIWAGLGKVGLLLAAQKQTWLGVPLYFMGAQGIFINILLAILNCIPLPPLDGAKFISNLLPPRIGYYFYLIEPYSMFILILLLITGVLSFIMTPAVIFLNNHIALMFGLPSLINF